MVGEAQAGLRAYPRHVAIDAVGRLAAFANRAGRMGLNCGPDLRLSAGVFVAIEAMLIVKGVVAPERLVRVVAGQARQRALAFPEAGALAEVNRLVPDVPG